jgi:hypothetical protein
MGIVLRQLTAAILLLCWASLTVLADTAAGVAAYDKGDYEAARALLKPEAEKGDPEAQVKYGLIFAKGLGVPPDAAGAFAWFQKAAAQGNVEAMYCMGVAYDAGDAGQKDLAKAVEWYRKAAEQDHLKAQYNLGQMLLKGDGVPADHAEAVKWLQKAADKEYGAAEFYLAMAYLEGTEPNLFTARYWAERAEKHQAKDADRLAGVIREGFKRAEAEGLPRTMGGDGMSIERAIALPDAKATEEAIKAENAVIRYIYPGWRKTGQRLASGPKGRPYDIIEIEKDGRQKDVYFDIANFFGKPN